MKQLHEYSITELKAIAYDQITFIERAQQIIKAVNDEMNKRANEVKKEVKNEQQVSNPE